MPNTSSWIGCQLSENNSYPLDSLDSAECADGELCCSAIDVAGEHTRLLVWGLRRPPARATCPAPCPAQRYTAASASTALPLSRGACTPHCVITTQHTLATRVSTHWHTAQLSRTNTEDSVSDLNNALLHKHLQLITITCHRSRRQIGLKFKTRNTTLSINKQIHSNFYWKRDHVSIK